MNDKEHPTDRLILEGPYYTVIPDEAIRNAGLTPYAFKLFAIILSEIQGGQGFPSTEKLATISGMTRNKVDKCLDELRRAKLVFSTGEED